MSSLHTGLPSLVPPEGLILVLSALASSFQPRHFSWSTEKCFVPGLAGYFTKAWQGQGKPHSELDIHQRNLIRAGQCPAVTWPALHPTPGLPDPEKRHLALYLLPQGSLLGISLCKPAAGDQQ